MLLGRNLPLPGDFSHLDAVPRESARRWNKVRWTGSRQRRHTRATDESESRSSRLWSMTLARSSSGMSSMVGVMLACEGNCTREREQQKVNSPPSLLHQSQSDATPHPDSP